MKHLILTLLVINSINLNAQNIFPVKLDNCNTETFCLDCGDIKAGYDDQGFAKLIEKLNKDLDLKGIKGSIKFQVLVDSNGEGCVLSHTDKSNLSITTKIIKALNKFKQWTPASTNGKLEKKSSINLNFSIKDNEIKGQIERVDKEAFKKSFDRPLNPEIFNKDFQYTNENLKNYTITVWNSTNSNLPNNMTDHITIDTNNLIWLSIDDGLVTFDGKSFKNVEQNITEKGKNFDYYEIGTDNNNTKWVHAKNNIYSFDNEKWIKYDSSEIGTDRANDIINNKTTGEVFISSFNGLFIYDKGKWSTINKNNTRELTSNVISFAKRDSKNRLWIGSFGGTIMIDDNGEITNFENSETVLKGKCITSMDEDEEGNLYFSLYEFDRKDKGSVNNNEGIAIRYSDGSFKQYTTENSGMPFNHANCVLYDKFERILWISTDRAGLVRFDLKNQWENYHNLNSDIPTSYISEMIFDENGNLFLATRQGLVKIERK